MLKLHGFSVSNYANMVKHCLIEKGVEFEQLDVRPSQDEDYLAISPMGKVPCLETPDGHLIETAAILDYLEQVYPTPAMFPADAFARAKAKEIMHVAELYIELAARRHLGSAFFGREQSEEALVEVRPQVEKGLRALTQLADFGPFVMGSEFGNADIYVYQSFRLASPVLKLTYDWNPSSDVPGYGDFIAAMKERDSTKTVDADNEAAMAAMMAQLAAAKQQE
jgi:glutathione S-transferase